jgi:hypothetical protein
VVLEPNDVLAVIFAALCHDLGHPCFSHMFEVFMRQFEGNENWSHEAKSKELVHCLLHDCKPAFQEANISFTDQDIEFVKDLIDPDKDALRDAHQSNTIVDRWNDITKGGRGIEKSFLYDIVSNWRNGLDVDKFDYFKRDAYYLGVNRSFDHERYFTQVMVRKDKTGVYTLAPPDKAKHFVRTGFELRAELHRIAYQHKTVKKLETHMIEVLKGINEISEVKVRSGGVERGYSLREASQYVGPDHVGPFNDECKARLDAYANLTDSFIEGVLVSSESEPALEYRKRFIDRKMMRVAGSWDFYDPQMKRTLGTKEEIVEKVLKKYNETKKIDPPHNVQLPALDESTVVCNLADFHQGMKDQDPMKHVFFYSTHDSKAAGTLEDANASDVLQLSCFIFYNPHRDIDNREEPVNTILKRLNRAFQEVCDEAGAKLAPKEVKSQDGEPPNKMPRIHQEGGAGPRVLQRYSSIAGDPLHG